MCSSCYEQMGVGTTLQGDVATTTIQGLGMLHLTPPVAETEPRHQKEMREDHEMKGAQGRDESLGECDWRTQV